MAPKVLLKCSLYIFKDKPCCFYQSFIINELHTKSKITAANFITIFHHVHVHLIPRFRGDMEDPRGGVRGVIPEK